MPRQAGDVPALNSIQQRLNRIRNVAKERSQQLSTKSRDSSSTALSNGTGCSSSLQSSSPHVDDLESCNDEGVDVSGDKLVGFVPASRQPIPASSSLHNIDEETPPQNVTEPLKEREMSAQTESSQMGRSKSNSQLPSTQRRRLQVNGRCYTLLNSLGRGGSSVVYQALSESDFSCVAIKCVDLSRAEQHVRSAYENEIKLLQSLQPSPYVIKLHDYEKRNGKLYVVLEKGDIDLASFMQKRSEKIDDKFTKYHWQEMLRCVKVIHDRWIVHSDLKPSNFLFVHAGLKLIDFGIASNIPANRTSVVKDVQIGTLNYMSPEAINGSYTSSDGSTLYKIPLASDVWSLGCILYQLAYGRTPFQHINNQIAKIQAISSATHRIDFPPTKDPLLLDVLKRCLVRNVKERASVDQLLSHPYLQ